MPNLAKIAKFGTLDLAKNAKFSKFQIPDLTKNAKFQILDCPKMPNLAKLAKFEIRDLAKNVKQMLDLIKPNSKKLNLTCLGMVKSELANP